MKIFKYLLSLSIVIIIASSCSDDITGSDGSGGTTDDGFNRKEMLTNWVNNIIIPSYEAFDLSLNKLKNDVEAFTSSPNTSSLNAVRLSWLDAYKAWQYVEMYNIGKAEEIYYSSYMNIYPLSLEKFKKDINGNITNELIGGIIYNLQNGNYNLDSNNTKDEQGFPALDYMLYGIASDDVLILEKYTTDPKASNHKQYLNDLINQMISKTDLIIADWNSNKDAVIAKDGNTKTSSTNKLTNDFVDYFEREFRANKIGIPAGIYSASTLPQDVEGYYGGVSRELHLASYNAVYNFFNGIGFNSNTSGESFKTYLEYLGTKKKMTENLLTDVINDQFAEINSGINSLLPNYADQVNTDNNKMTSTFQKIQLNVVNFKVEMMQAFKVSIDYTDSDGD